MKKVILLTMLVLISVSSGLKAGMCRWQNGSNPDYLSCIQQGDSSAAGCCEELGGEWLDLGNKVYDDYEDESEEIY